MLTFKTITSCDNLCLQLINCVYRDHGFKEGSPADALQYMSNVS